LILGIYCESDSRLPLITFTWIQPNASGFITPRNAKMKTACNCNNSSKKWKELVVLPESGTKGLKFPVTILSLGNQKDKKS